MRILLTGTYNCHNKGDATMELVARQRIRDALPDAEVVISSPFPALDGPFYAPTPLVPCSRRKLIRATCELLAGLLWRAARAVSGQDLPALLPGAAMKATRRADLVIDLSGDMLTESSGPHVAYSHFIPLLRALVLGRPYLLCAQSIGPFRLTRPLARFLLRRAAAITVREQVSRDYLQSLGIDPSLVRQTADLAFLLEPAPAERAREIMASEGVPLDAPCLIGLSVSRLIESRYRKGNPEAGRRDFAALMAAVIDALVERTGATVVLVPHVTGPSEAKDDRRIGREIRKLVARPCAVRGLEGDYRPEELKAVIAQCRVFVGARMHANMAALASGVPTVALAYSHKTRGIMAACGQSERVVPIEALEPKALLRQVEQALAQREAISAALAGPVDAQRRAAAANLTASGLTALAAPRSGDLKTHEPALRHDGAAREPAVEG